MKVDLHMHTTCSDGMYSPDVVVQMAAQAGLGTIAISDHDTVEAYHCLTLPVQGIRIIPAMEMSSDYEGEDVHILGFYLNPSDPAIVSYCAQFKQRRQQRAMEIVARCESLGYVLDRPQIEETLSKGGTIGRPHIARMLIAKGYFPDVAAVFEHLLYRGGPAYVPYRRQSINACISLIRQAGGLAVLAHPGLLKRTLSAVLAHSFDGIEVYHPKNQGRYEEFLAIAREKHWYVSGGSDFHGVPGRFPEKVGVYTVDSEKVQDLLSYR